MRKGATKRIGNLPVGTEVYYGFTCIGVVGVNIDKRLNNLCVYPNEGCGLYQIKITNRNEKLVKEIWQAQM